MKSTRKPPQILPPTQNEPGADGNGTIPASIEDVQAQVAEAAYFLAEQRGFTPGSEMEDWLAAEAQLRARSENT